MLIGNIIVHLRFKFKIMVTNNYVGVHGMAVQAQSCYEWMFNIVGAHVKWHVFIISFGFIDFPLLV